MPRIRRAYQSDVNDPQQNSMLHRTSESVISLTTAACGG